MLEIASLTKRYANISAVDNVSLTIRQGQMVGVIGRSGAGKSTLLRMLNRLAEPTTGAIIYNGTDITKLRGADLLDWRARCAMIFQQFNLIPRVDVLTNVLVGRFRRRHTLLSMFNHFTAAERALALMALDRLDMAPQALQRADTLSGGQQQRVAIARALVQEPELILADEPIASLDPRSATKVMAALHRVNREDGLTVICNLHTLDTARTYCDRIVGMAHGRLVFDGAPDELTTSAVREIYGATDGDFREEITSTSVTVTRPLHDFEPAAALAS